MCGCAPSLSKKPMNLNEPRDLASLIEAFLLASGKPQSLERLYELFEEAERPEPKVFKKALEVLGKSCAGRAFELKEVASGYRLQIREDFAPWVGRLWEERPQRYSRALLETMALIAYRQPITRGEIEDVRGVAVNSNIIKTLMEREWIRVVGYREVPAAGDVRHHQGVSRSLQPQEPGRIAGVGGASRDGAGAVARSG